MRLPLLARFSLYGFLKNQQYYEPFFFLALREKGLSFTQIGFLIGFREVCSNLLNVPSGVVADLYGRRKSMALALSAYVASFLAFGLARRPWALVMAMALFAVGESFRAGTHKSMIFEWLRREGRLAERTKIYGYTRSWSKLGSAVSVPLGAALVLWTGSYGAAFLFSAIPYAANAANCLTYPGDLDAESTAGLSPRAMLRFLGTCLGYVFRRPALRRVYLESMGFEVTYDQAMQYLQPVLKSAMATAAPLAVLPFLASLDLKRRTALLVGAVYFGLHLLSSWASRHSHTLADRAGGEERAARWLWALHFAGFAGMTLCLSRGRLLWAAPCFLLLSALQNFWRPGLMSRIDSASNPEMGTTLLSIESQLKSACVMLLAPILGRLVDAHGFWPVGLLGLGVSAAALAAGRSGGRPRGREC